MPEALATLDGERLDVDRTEAQFAAAMAAPPSEKPGMAAPARKPPEPPVDPQQAPHGWTWADGEWRPKKAPGRPRTPADKPRVTDSPPAPPPAATHAAAPARDYRTTLKEAAEALWFVLAAAPVPQQAFGFKLTNVRRNLRVQAALIESNVDNLAGGLNLIAQHNKFVARAVARVEKGEGGLWVLPAVMLLAPLAAQTGQLWSGQLTDPATLEAIATKTEQDVGTYLAKMAEAATETATAAA
jgi:hypothetical protein